MKRLGSISFLLTILSVFSPLYAQETEDQVERRYSPEEIQKDLCYLYETLEEGSYDLYRFTRKSIFEKEFDAIYSSITDSLTFLEINRLFQSFVAMANFQHCSIGYPVDEYRTFYKNGGRFFPLEIKIVDDKPIVIIDYSENENINIGDEIISINGEPFQDILAKIIDHMSGENDYARQAILETRDFSDYYWYLFGDFPESSVKLKNPSGNIVTIHLKGVLLNEYLDYLKRHPRNSSSLSIDREFRYIDEVAYLHPGPFYNINSGSGSVSDQEFTNSVHFKRFIDSVFVDISQRSVNDLIIDIRGNAGGNDSFSSYMMAYFVDKPFKIASELSMKTSQITKDQFKDVDTEGNPDLAKLKEQIMTLEDGTKFTTELKINYPRDDTLHYNGRVYVLIDRFSFSMAAVVASIVQDYEFGFVVGEETSYVPSSCASMHEFALPNTGIKAYYAKACGVRPNGDISNRGVIPDHLIRDAYNTEEDEVLQYTLKLIGSTDIK